MTRTTRRTVLAAACGTCAAALTGCAAYGSGRAAPVAQSAPGPAPATVAPAAVADIPVGGGTVFPAQDLVITQPTAGTLAAFSATCTHQGCAVSAVSDGVIVCPCHGSTFDIADGTPVEGPATQPLPARLVRVEDGAIVVV